MPLKLGISGKNLSTSNCVQMMTLGWPFYTKVNFSALCICMVKGLIVDYYETI